MFLRLCYHDSLPTKKLLAQRCISSDACCLLYNGIAEDVLNVLTHCKVVDKLQKDLQLYNHCLHLENMPFDTWLRTGCAENSPHGNLHIRRSTIFSYGYWSLQNYRNHIFDKKLTRIWLRSVFLEQLNSIILDQSNVFQYHIFHLLLGGNRLHWDGIN